MTTLVLVAGSLGGVLLIGVTSLIGELSTYILSSWSPVSAADVELCLGSCYFQRTKY